MIDEVLTIRPPTRSDEPALISLLCDLDPAARLAFRHVISDAVAETYARQTLATSLIIVGAFIRAQLTGVAEVTRMASHNTATLAFVVDADRRRQGIGSRLLLAAVAWTTEHGLSSVQLQCSRSNWAVRQIAQNAKAKVSLTSDRFIAHFEADAIRTSAFSV